MSSPVSAEQFDRARDVAVRIFDPGYEELTPARRLMLNVDMQAALICALRALGIEVDP